MHFDEEFVKSLPDDWQHAIPRLNARLQEVLAGTESAQERHRAAEEALLLLNVYQKNKNLKWKVPALAPDIPHEHAVAIAKDVIGRYKTEAEEAIARMTRKAELDHYANLFSIALGSEFHYEFSEGDMARVQALVNELRDLIAASKDLRAEHKRRVLSRLEKLQSELHKKVSDLAWLWGELIEASVAARIMGENAKPIVERIREIASIVWPVQARAFDLPSNTPFRLPGQTDEEKPRGEGN
jgi:hypothetical protein